MTIRLYLSSLGAFVIGVPMCYGLRLLSPRAAVTLLSAGVGAHALLLAIGVLRGRVRFYSYSVPHDKPK